MANKRGDLIALEGKTKTFTQLAAIQSKMGEKSVMIQFPDLNSPIGSILHHEIEVHVQHLLTDGSYRDKYNIMGCTARSLKRGERGT